MRSTAVKLAKSYTPMIKFVGTKHTFVQHGGEMKMHPCAADGLQPGSEECVSAADFLAKQKPFRVVAYKASQAPKKDGSRPTDLHQKYAFKDRPLQENEVASILDLPARYRMPPMDELEIDAINAGGAL
ncbi:LAMI_0D01640g1_1 [Lachancea mirantina]|uniref:LAMI_0D01640g1_1 n=1 Tax=Lachancea mirantina TaxID=1230905 RepID=A0A1G4J8Q8_9SACH|nr:LAMI_0D01640g1_1 [Lachancea mirantina]